MRACSVGMKLLPLFGLKLIKMSSLTKLAHVGSRSLPVLNLIKRSAGESRYHSFLHRLSQVVAGSLIAFTGAAVAHSVEQCPVTGRWRLLMTSLEEDEEVGTKISHALLSGYAPDLVLASSHPLTRICQHLADRIAQPGYSGTAKGFKVIVISDSRKNAFSLPNGDIIVHAGLVGDVADENELAGLLAHEMAHTILRHSSEVVSVSDFMRIPSGLVYSAVASSGSSVVTGAFRWLAVEMVRPERFITGLPVSRRLEAEADRVGLDLMVNAGFDPRAMARYWQRQPVDATATLASTHPHNADRLSEIEAYIVFMGSAAETQTTVVTGELDSGRWWWQTKRDDVNGLKYWISRISSQLD